MYIPLSNFMHWAASLRSALQKMALHCIIHLGCFLVLAIVNIAAMNTGVDVSFRIVIFSGICPVVGLLGHMVRLDFSGGASGKEPTYQCRRHIRPGFDPWVGKIPWEDPLEKGMATTHSRILAWSIPWTEEPGGL